MTRFLRGQSCLRQYFTVYLNGNKKIACSVWVNDSEIRIQCNVCLTDATHRNPRKLFIPPAAQVDNESPPTTANNFWSTFIVNALEEILNVKTPEIPVSIPSATTDVGSIVPHTVVPAFDIPRNSPEFTIFSNDTHADGNENDLVSDDNTQFSENFGNNNDEAVIYEMAVRFARNEIIDRKKSFDFYETRVVEWGRACILCFFHQRRLIESPHSNCVQNEHKPNFDIFRRHFRIKNFMGCYNCGHMQAICSRRNRNGSCMQPWLVWHVAWVVYHFDIDVGRQMILLLKNPNLINGVNPRLYWFYCHWLAEGTEFFNRQISNMGRLLYYWLDRLETLCIDGG